MKTFSARETIWLQELDGLELATFRPRAFAFLLDWVLISILLTLVFGLGGLAYVSIQRHLGHPTTDVDLDTHNGFLKITPDKPATAPKKRFTYQVGLPSGHEPPANEPTSRRILEKALDLVSEILIPVLYFGFFLWQGNGRTPGKRLLKIRVVSLVHTHISFWHAIERALGYGAASLELGFGFIQYFIHPYRRCAQDRLAETIVITERSYQQKFPQSLRTLSEAKTKLQ